MLRTEECTDGYQDRLNNTADIRFVCWLNNFPLYRANVNKQANESFGTQISIIG